MVELQILNPQASTAITPASLASRVYDLSVVADLPGSCNGPGFPAWGLWVLT